MKSLEIIKETEDLRPNRNKILTVGTKFQCLDELANKYIKKKLAREVDANIIKIEEEKQTEKVEDKD